jgi:hypothetical protein
VPASAGGMSAYELLAALSRALYAELKLASATLKTSDTENLLLTL